jgi:hypothetical protein
LSVLLSFGHCIVCPSVFWPLYCLSFCLLAIVLSVLLSFGHCIVCPSVFWPLYSLSDIPSLKGTSAWLWWANRTPNHLATKRTYFLPHGGTIPQKWATVGCVGHNWPYVWYVNKCLVFCESHVPCALKIMCSSW